MAKFTVEQIKEMLPRVPDKKLNEAITKGVLKLSDEEIETLMFVFGLCHLAERDLGAVLTKPWEQLAKTSSPEDIQRAKEGINDFLSREKDGEPTLDDSLLGLDPIKADKIRAVVKARYRPKRLLDIDQLESFGEKIRAYETIFFKNNVSELLWDLKEIRDDLSHGRINSLEYRGTSLMKRETKEKILLDYLATVNNADHSKSRLNDELVLSASEKEEVGALLKRL